MAGALRHIGEMARARARRRSDERDDGQALAELEARPLAGLPAGLEVEWLGVSGYRLSFEGTTLGADNAWFSACASRRMLDVANAYLRLSAKLSYVDLWYTAQQPASDERVASQNWHVDFDDKHLLKAFVYLSDVGADQGPFEYVPGSQPGGPHHSVRPWVPMGYGRVPDADVAKSVPADEIATFTGPKGTLILCNTSGLHRGGFATAGPRILATATYCSPASLKSLSNRNYETTLESDDPVVRYALS